MAIFVSRTENFASPGRILRDKPRTYERPTRLSLNEWALSGDWTVKRDTAVLNEAGGSITYRFHARDLHLVMGPAVRGSSVAVRSCSRVQRRSVHRLGSRPASITPGRCSSVSPGAHHDDGALMGGS